MNLIKGASPSPSKNKETLSGYLLPVGVINDFWSGSWHLLGGIGIFFYLGTHNGTYKVISNEKCIISKKQTR